MAVRDHVQNYEHVASHLERIISRSPAALSISTRLVFSFGGNDSSSEIYVNRLARAMIVLVEGFAKPYPLTEILRTDKVNRRQSKLS